MKSVLSFRLVGRTLLTQRSAFDFEDLLPGCWSDQGSCELALRRTIQLFEHPPFPGEMINYCIPIIRTPPFEITSKMIYHRAASLSEHAVLI